jgi:hypothetical protein
MKQILKFLEIIGWIDLPKNPYTYQSPLNPEEIPSLWGIPSLYQSFPDLIGK